MGPLHCALMEIDAVGAIPSPRRPVELVGVTAELAEARTKLREAAPSGRWDAVVAEVSRLQYEQKMSPLAALRTVHAMLASGWVPPTVR
jgi:predicted AAA+ superfamily ATPase